MIKLVFRILFLSLLSMPLLAAETLPMKQGFHQWQVPGGRLFLVVGTYQDVIHYKRTYNFYFKKTGDRDWNQVLLVDKKGDALSTWESASSGELTLADGIVVSRTGAVYFVVGSKEVKGSYYDKSTIRATWYKFALSGDDKPEEPLYQLKPVFTRVYPNTALTVEDILAKESHLEPSR